MKNVLGIIGSTRKMGNSELAVKMISRQIPEPHSLSLIRLSDMKLKYCLGCYQCFSKDGRCVQDDDMEIFLDALAKADGVILSIPVYFFGPISTIKMVVDRSCMLYPRFKKFIGKPCLIAMLLGIEGKDGYTLAALGSAAMTMGLDIKGVGSFVAAGLGEVLIKEENHELAKELARMLFSPKREIPQDGKRCQICGAQAFKYIENRVECLVCQNQGEMIFENGQVKIDIKMNSLSEVMTLEDRRHHFEWVKEKKKGYKDMREEIKRKRRQFSEEGVWIVASQ